jgi:glycosyltransferase involved in cell wall biosynthesis
MKIYVDVTETVIFRLNTGIQRVVREVVRSSESVGARLGVKVVPVVATSSKFYVLENLTPLFDLTASPSNVQRVGRIVKSIPYLWSKVKAIPQLSKIVVGMAHKAKTRLSLRAYIAAKPISPEEGDMILLLDSFWGTGEALRSIERYRKNNVSVYAVLYDVIPFTHPQYCDETLVREFNRLFFLAFGEVDGGIAISASVADDAKKLFLTKDGIASGLPIDFFYLGAKFSNHLSQSLTSDISWPDGIWGRDPVFMMVGTIEPRKGHKFVFEAFERRWRQGRTEKLLIVGKIGWKTEELISSIKQSPFYGSLLFMVNDASDAQLQDAYSQAYACIMASYVEGFGLPVIEALQKGMPVICSNIPVFKEIADKNAVFFELNDYVSFDQAIENLRESYDSIRKGLENFHWLSWEESTEQLLRKVCAMNEAHTKGSVKELLIN